MNMRNCARANCVGSGNLHCTACKSKLKRCTHQLSVKPEISILLKIESDLCKIFFNTALNDMEFEKVKISTLKLMVTIYYHIHLTIPICREVRKRLHVIPLETIQFTYVRWLFRSRNSKAWYPVICKTRLSLRNRVFRQRTNLQSRIPISKQTSTSK